MRSSIPIGDRSASRGALGLGAAGCRCNRSARGKGVGGQQPVGNAIAAGSLAALALFACAAEKTRAFVIETMTDLQARKPSSRELRAAHCASKWLGLALLAMITVHFNAIEALERQQQEKVASKLSKMSAAEIMRAIPFSSRETREEPSSDNVLFEPKDASTMVLALEMKRRGFDRHEDEERLKEQLLSAWSRDRPQSHWEGGAMAMSAMMLTAAVALSLCVMAKNWAIMREFEWPGGLSLARSLALRLGKAGKSAAVGAIKAPWLAALGMGRVILSLAKAVVRAPSALSVAPKEAAAIAGSLAKSYSKARQSLIDRGMGGAKGWSEAERDQIAAEIPEAQPAASTRRRL